MNPARLFRRVAVAAFVTYCLATVVVAVDQRWSVGRVMLGLAAAVPPFVTVWFARRVHAGGGLHTRWRLAGTPPG